MDSVWVWLYDTIAVACRALRQAPSAFRPPQPNSVLRLSPAAAQPSPSQAAQNKAYLQKASGYDPEKYVAWPGMWCWQGSGSCVDFMFQSVALKRIVESELKRMLLNTPLRLGS